MLFITPIKEQYVRKDVMLPRDARKKRSRDIMRIGSPLTPSSHSLSQKLGFEHWLGSKFKTPSRIGYEAPQDLQEMKPFVAKELPLLEPTMLKCPTALQRGHLIRFKTTSYDVAVTKVDSQFCQHFVLRT